MNHNFTIIRLNKKENSCFILRNRCKYNTFTTAKTFAYFLGQYFNYVNEYL
jgi:hypothetical protein